MRIPAVVWSQLAAVTKDTTRIWALYGSSEWKAVELLAQGRSTAEIAAPDEDGVLAAARAGADGYLAKTWNPAQVTPDRPRGRQRRDHLPPAAALAAAARAAPGHLSAQTTERPIVTRPLVGQ